MHTADYGVFKHGKWTTVNLDVSAVKLGCRMTALTNGSSAYVGAVNSISPETTT
jgi:hypothetical protein